LKEAEKMAENKNLKNACNPKNIGQSSEYNDSMSAKSRDKVGESLRKLSDSIAGIGHAILKVDGEDEGAQSINRIRDKVSDAGFAIKRILGKEYTPSNANLENALKHLDQHLDEILQLFHLEHHPSIPDGHGMPDDEMSPIKNKLSDLARAMELTEYKIPDWSVRIMHRIRVLAMGRHGMHGVRDNSLRSAFGDEMTEKWKRKYGNESRLNRRSWDPAWQDAMDAQDAPGNQFATNLAQKQQEVKDKNAAKEAEAAANAKTHQEWLKKLDSDGEAPF
jgi:hypothetical protein